VGIDRISGARIPGSVRDRTRDGEERTNMTSSSTSWRRPSGGSKSSQSYRRYTKPSEAVSSAGCCCPSRAVKVRFTPRARRAALAMAKWWRANQRRSGMFTTRSTRQPRPSSFTSSGAVARAEARGCRPKLSPPRRSGVRRSCRSSRSGTRAGSVSGSPCLGRESTPNGD
jgi:hypothetical protein